MSTDYQIFFQELDNVPSDLNLLSEVQGVKLLSNANIEIEGLSCVTCSRLNDHSRLIMENEYGRFGQIYDWAVRGTYDCDCELSSVIRRLFLCAAALINARSQRNVALMRNGESIYVYNNHEGLIICPYFTEEMPDLSSFFNRPCEILEIRQWV